MNGRLRQFSNTVSGVPQHMGTHYLVDVIVSSCCVARFYRARRKAAAAVVAATGASTASPKTIVRRRVCLSAATSSSASLVLESPSSAFATRATSTTEAKRPFSSAVPPPFDSSQVAQKLDSIQCQGPGACESFVGLTKGQTQLVTDTATSLGLCCKREVDCSLSVYVPGTELAFGGVPYSFQELGLHEDLLQALSNWEPCPLEHATHVQASAIPRILAGDDIVIKGETGSGKTLAYLLPAAHAAIERALDAVATADGVDDEDAADGNRTCVMCFRVEKSAGSEGIRTHVRPDAVSPFTRNSLHVGDQFVARGVCGSPEGMQFVEMSDGRGWVPWDRESIRFSLSLSAVEFRLGQRVQALEDLEYGSGDVVRAGTHGKIERLLPLVGVRWDGLDGIKAIRCPRQVLGRPKIRGGTRASKWGQSAPDTVIITPTRELCEQVADVARQLGSLLPEYAQREWRVATAVGLPPGVDKIRMKGGREEWPFPIGEGAPRVLVTTLDFMACFYHKRNLPLWAGIRYIVYDEVDSYFKMKRQRIALDRVKHMFLRTQRSMHGRTQIVAVASTIPNNGARSAQNELSQWMASALRALPTPDLFHRQHPMIEQKWNYVPGDRNDSFEGKAKLLVDYLNNAVGTIMNKHGRDRKLVLQTKVIVFCESDESAMTVAEFLATTKNFEGVGLLLGQLPKHDRRERMRMFRDGRIMLMVCTDVLARGIDVPGLSHVVQFHMATNVVDHIHRIGRTSRVGTRGHALNLYDDSKKGGRAIAEAIQEVGDRPLDALFSQNGQFRRSLERKESFRQLLLMQGLPLPPHLQLDSDVVEDAQLLLQDASGQEDQRWEDESDTFEDEEDDEEYT